jgi:hypothetical protein
MTKEEKIDIILNDISLHFQEFLKQAKYKLQKQKKICDDSSYRELVSDIVFSLTIKLDNITHINFYYQMVLNNKLYLYILKGIDTNTRYPRSPFLYKRIKEMNRIQHNDNYFHKDTDEFCFSNKEERILDEIYLMLTPERAPHIFGIEWKYYIALIEFYITNPKSYSKIEKIDNIKSSPYYYRKCWRLIRQELENKGLL